MHSVTSNAVANTLNTVTVQSFPNAGVILHNIGKVCWCTYVGSLSGYQSGWRYEGIIPPGLRPDTDVRVVMVNNTLDSYGGQAVIRAASGDVVFYRPGGGTFSADTFAASWAWIAS